MFEDRPDESDGYVSETRGGYAVSLDGRYVDTFERETRAWAALYLELQRAGYYPNLWFQNERGNVEQVVFDSHTPRYIGNGYV